jgi:hypothetical protein
VLTVSSVTNGTHGISSIVNGTTIHYIPNQNYNGNDTITYKISDGQGGEVEQTIDVTINSVNDRPIIEDLSLSTLEDEKLEINFAPHYTDVEGDPFTLHSINGVELTSEQKLGTEDIEILNGILRMTNDTTAEFTPNEDYNAEGQSPLSFNYTVKDGELISEPATVTIEVTPVNDPPFIKDGNYTDLMNANATIGERITKFFGGIFGDVDNTPEELKCEFDGTLPGNLTTFPNNCSIGGTLNETGTFPFGVRACDPQSLCSQYVNGSILGLPQTNFQPGNDGIDPSPERGFFDKTENQIIAGVSGGLLLAFVGGCVAYKKYWGNKPKPKKRKRKKFNKKNDVELKEIATQESDSETPNPESTEVGVEVTSKTSPTPNPSQTVVEVEV